MHNYEKLVNDNQQLKKSVSDQKVAYENVLAQMENLHRMYEQLQNLLKQEQEKNKELKRQLTVKIQKSNQLATQYQQHLENFKLLIDSKDMQLRKVNNQLLVTDYEMIRIRVLNEVELVHHQQLQQKDQQLKRIQTQLLVNKQKFQLLQQKTDKIEDNINTLKDDHNREKQKLMHNQSKQLNEFYHKIQIQQQKNRALARQKVTLQKKLQNLKVYYETELNNLTYENTKENRPTNDSSKYNPYSHQAQLKLKKAYQQIDDLRDQLRKTLLNHKKSIQTLQKRNKKLEEELASYHKAGTVLITPHSDSVSNNFLENKIVQLKQQHRILQAHLEKQIKQLSLQCREKDVTIRELQNRLLQKEDFNYSNNPVFNENTNIFKQEIKNLKQLIKHQNKNQQGTNRNFNDLKYKLQEANHKIVSLLKEKVQLKKQIARQQGRY